MTVKVLDYRGDGAYYLCDPALELEGLRDGDAGRVHRGHGTPAGALAELLGDPTPDGRRALDVVIAAPKPVSLLLADGSSSARALVALHDRAVAEVLSYLDEDDPAPRSLLGARVVGFTHGVNRRLDPHLHTHLLVSVRDPAGAPIDARGLRWRAGAADALYQAALREGLPAACGRVAWVGRTRSTQVEGVDLGQVAASSSPRDRAGRVEPGGPKRHPSREEVVSRWQERLMVGLGVTAPRPAPGPPGHLDEVRFARELGQGTVGRADVVRALAWSCDDGERPGRVLRDATLLAPGLGQGRRLPAALLRDDAGRRVLGDRPRDPAALAAWGVRRRALAAYLGAGHRLAHVRDPGGAPASTRLALATLDAALGTAGCERAVVREPSVGRELT